MLYYNKLLSLILFLSLASCSTIPIDREIATTRNKISKAAKQLVDWETKGNGVSIRSNEKIKILHYEIPLRMLQSDADALIDSHRYESLVFEKNGEKYVRWIINPEDTQWHLELKKFLDEHQIDSTPKEFFEGYLTASRSMIIVNPENGATFSLKVSTNKTGGNWTNKKQTWIDAQQVRNMNRWMTEVIDRMKTKTLVIMDEPIAFGIKELDQGMIMRSLNDLPKGDHYYLPGFSAFHNRVGKEIAELNGATDIVEFWDKNYNRPLAKAFAEFFAYTGAWYDSPHSQNFLIELDQNKRPTGRIVFRDLGDTYLLNDFAANTKYAHLSGMWEDGNVFNHMMSSAVGLLHGNEKPQWISEKQYDELGRNFFQTFEENFSKLTGVSKEDLQETFMYTRNFSYMTKKYPTTSPSWQKFLEYANCMNGEKKTLSGKACLDIYLKLQDNIDCFKTANGLIMNH